MNSSCARRNSFTLVELLVVVAVIGIIMALTIPAVQAARESSRNVACQNNLRQIGMGLAGHEMTYRHFPSGGWGFQWVGDPDRGSGPSQPGGWIFATLPFLEAENVHNMGRGQTQPMKADSLGRMMKTPVTVFNCPSRRPAKLEPFQGQLPLHNAVKPSLAFKNDYAGCAGDLRLPNRGGPQDDTPQSLTAYPWPGALGASGIFFAGSQVRAADVMDGLSNTYVAGEKYTRIDPTTSPNGRDFGDDQSAFVGDDYDVRRWTEDPPLRDHRLLDAYDSFGSRHPSTWNALVGDGSVRCMAFAIDREVHRSLGHRCDNRPQGTF